MSVPAKLTLAWLLVLALSAPAGAADPPGWGIGNQMTSLFDTLLNHTAPTAHLGQRRGVVTGGSLNARNRIMNESLWHFVPPSFNAGCGGIDLFAGSFSFVSAEQFQQLLRAIAANAAGYAFEVALGAMCKECLETMETLQKKIQALNQGFANSCQLAKGLVNDVADAFDVKHKDNTSLLGMVKGLGDVFETRSSAGGADPIAQVRDNVPAADKTRIEGNLVWQALKRKGAAGWFLEGDDTLLEAMMSVTGSVIVGPPEDAPDGQGPNHRITYLPGNLLKAADLLNGTRDREDATEHANAWPHRLRLYQCGPAGGPIDRSENGCLEPSVREDRVNGMIQRVKDVLIGVRPWGPGTETLGLVQKFRLGQGAVTPAEQAFMQYAPNGLGAGIRTLARHDEGMARLFVEQAAPVIALELTQVILNDLLFAVEQAAALNAHAYAKQLLTQIEHARAQLYREYAVLDDRYGNPQTLLAYYQGLVEEIKGRRYYGIEQAAAAPATQQ
jgi:conjugative transfer pilus assembly protein TraH